MTHRLSIPCRWQVDDLPDGCKLLRLFINGAPAGVFLWDGTTLTETKPGDPHNPDTKGYDHG